jgi:hypothetical protein
MKYSTEIDIVFVYITWVLRGRDSMVVEFMTTYATSAYHH